MAPLAAALDQARQQGGDRALEPFCLAILAQSPGHPDALWALSRLRLAEGKSAAVEALVRRILTLNPDDARASQDLALRLMRVGDPAEADSHARNAVRTAPNDPQSHAVMAMVLTEGLKPHAADAHYRRAIALRLARDGVRDPILLSNHALCLRMQGRMAEGRALYREAQAAAPLEVAILLDWARLEEADQQVDAAAALVDRAERLAPGHPGLRLLRAVLLGRQGDHVAALALLDAEPPGGEEWLERGRLLDRAGRHAEGFAAWDAGRAAMRADGEPQYGERTATGMAARLGRVFNAGLLATLPRATPRPDLPQPVFILGFPRSGTTLVEQTLTATDAIAPGGELPLLWEVVGAAPRLLDSPLPYPEALAELWMADRAAGLDVLRDHYLYRARQFGVPPEAGLFTDKMPLNEMHLGLLGLMFPKAPLIHVLRHPLDVVLSVYSNNLTHGFHCSASLESAARHYVLVAGLVEQYRSQMTLNYLAVRYEDLARDQERQVRRMLDFVGVPFDPAHLRFHENRRRAPTASYAQVTEPLYGRSVERWRAYRAQLAPVISILRPVIERLGYDCG